MYCFLIIWSNVIKNIQKNKFASDKLKWYNYFIVLHNKNVFFMIALIFLCFFVNFYPSSSLFIHEKDFSRTINALHFDKIDMNTNTLRPKEKNFSDTITYVRALKKHIKVLKEQHEKHNQRVNEIIELNNKHIAYEIDKTKELIKENENKTTEEIQQKKQVRLEKKQQTYKQKILDYMIKRRNELFPNDENIDDIEPIFKKIKDDDNFITEINQGFSTIKEKLKKIQVMNNVIDQGIVKNVVNNDTTSDEITDNIKLKIDNELYYVIHGYIYDAFYKIPESCQRLLLFEIYLQNLTITDDNPILYIDDYEKKYSITMKGLRSLVNFIKFLPTTIYFFGKYEMYNIIYSEKNELEKALANARTFYSLQGNEKKAIELYYELKSLGMTILTENEKSQKHNELQQLLTNDVCRNPYFQRMRQEMYPNTGDKIKNIFTKGSGTSETQQNINSSTYPVINKNSNQTNKKGSRYDNIFYLILTSGTLVGIYFFVKYCQNKKLNFKSIFHK